MASRDELKAKVCAAIDSRAEEFVGLSQAILSNPEPGFRETKTSGLVSAKLREMGIAAQDGIALTGVKGELKAASAGPTVGLFGELDSLIVHDHPHSDSLTGAAHACGHHAQIGMLLSAAAGLLAPGVLDELSGRVVLFAVPAEEYIEIEYRDSLRRKGDIEFLGGKPEFIRLGHLDGVDMAMMCHTSSRPEEGMLALSGTNNGIVAKKVQFIGRGAHAGGAPHLGINALNAANLALMGIHANRETFKDEDTIRVHPIITKGGEAVSAVPADVRMESFVRGRTINAVLEANQKVDRALKAGAMAVGGKVNIQTLPGYLPLQQDSSLADIFRANAMFLVGEENVGSVGHRTGSTDMGDVSQLMPVIHPYVTGATGLGHGADYVIEDYSLAVTTAGKALACTVVDLLAEGASQGGQVVSNHKAAMSKAEYLSFMRGLAREEVFDYEEL